MTIHLSGYIKKKSGKVIFIMKKVAVIGIDHNYYKGMNRLMDKLRRSMKEPNLSFFQCGPSGWELYNRLLSLKVDKIIVIDQFESDEGDLSEMNYITINDQILIIGIHPIYFEKRNLPPELKGKLEQITFQIKRIILEEIALDSAAQV